MTRTEFQEFEGIFQELGNDCPQILGILATGSLFQYKDYLDFQEFPERQHNNYFAVDSAKCRNLGFSKSSDVDIWVTLKDHNLSSTIRAELDEMSIELMDSYSSLDLDTWAAECQQRFGKYCKNPEHYSVDWIAKNRGSFWESEVLQADAINRMTERMPEFCSRYNYFFDTSLNQFLEIRAFPESLLNVKLATVNATKYDRVPIPIWLRSWLTEFNTHVLYSSDESNIFPFKEDGIILGDKIGRHYGLCDLSDKDLYLRGFRG